MTDGVWYADGVHFGCQQGGDCCHNHGEYDRVYFSRREATKLARHLELTMTELRRRHLREEDGYLIARAKGGACEFLDGCRCSIYPVRPVPCRTWPFWSDTMERAAWDTEVVPFCQGVGRGRLHTREEIEASMYLKDAHDRELDEE